ncbi:MAG: hypothetical protein K0Q43_1457 [Ramlibacter sp.]|jgi:formyl-CoA transferase|nr:hypothetical protein [Ramlibacter sp.]
MQKVLSDVRILDLGRYIAGPYCAALLADYGADVIRVDRPGGSEDRFIVPVSDTGDGALFLQCNRNKRSITLDIDTDEGKEILHSLVRKADVVIANMPAATLRKLGLDYASLAAIKPDIILTSTSAFGSTGPLADRIGFDGVGQALSGAVHVSGSPDQPMKMMVPVVDFATGMSCAMATMMALYERRISGLGQEVSASLLQTSLNLASGSLIEEAVLRVDRKASLNRAPHYGPSDIFRVRDGWIITQVIGSAMFKRWALLVGQPGLIDDHRFADDRSRGEHGQELSAVMAGWCLQFTREDVLARLEQARIPAGSVNSPREVLDDAVIAGSGAFQPTTYPGVSGPVPLVSPPASLSRTPPIFDRRPPLAGEHTEEILAELGYTSAQTADLRTRLIV